MIQVEDISQWPETRVQEILQHEILGIKEAKSQEDSRNVNRKLKRGNQTGNDGNLHSIPYLADKCEPIKEVPGSVSVLMIRGCFSWIRFIV